jgi:hypothetical protein
MSTFADLVDRLCITNLKQWFVQDALHKAAAAGTALDAENTQKIVALNLERNRLMREIDETLAEAVKTGIARVDPRVKIT